jgi:hypothetical protein
LSGRPSASTFRAAAGRGGGTFSAATRPPNAAGHATLKVFCEARSAQSVFTSVRPLMPYLPVSLRKFAIVQT